ncbi:unnamed protein product, partial [Prorocentrum cordatum]
VKQEIEAMRWSEEQKTIALRGEEQRRSEDHSTQLHQARVAHETEQKKLADLDLMKEQEASNLRQEEVRRQGEKELLLLRLQSDERRAEMGVREAVERAKIEEEAKIKAARDNEDVNLRAMKAEMAEKREQTLAAIRETADIVLSWVTFVFRSPANLALGIGSIVVAVGGVYLMREMAVLLREQLNKRLGRPSLVRTTNRRGVVQEAWIGLLRLLRLRGRHGSEFDDVVLHPRLHQQVMRLADATRSAKARRMPLQHAMFYGPPGATARTRWCCTRCTSRACCGPSAPRARPRLPAAPWSHCSRRRTGKTMVAQRFAEYSGLEYAIMAGGDVAPLQEQAVTELHKLFKWVHRSRRGVLLFIDEADAFLASRNGTEMSEALRNALTTILYHTGTPSSQFMLVGFAVGWRVCDMRGGVPECIGPSWYVIAIVRMRRGPRRVSSNCQFAERALICFPKSRHAGNGIADRHAKLRPLAREKPSPESTAWLNRALSIARKMCVLAAGPLPIGRSAASRGRPRRVRGQLPPRRKEAFVNHFQSAAQQALGSLRDQAKEAAQKQREFRARLAAKKWRPADEALLQVRDSLIRGSGSETISAMTANTSDWSSCQKYLEKEAPGATVVLLQKVQTHPVAKDELVRLSGNPEACAQGALNAVCGGFSHLTGTELIAARGLGDILRMCAEELDACASEAARFAALLEWARPRLNGATVAASANSATGLRPLMALTHAGLSRLRQEGIGPGEAASLPALAAVDIRATARTFKERTAVGADMISPRYLIWLPGANPAGLYGASVMDVSDRALRSLRQEFGFDRLTRAAAWPVVAASLAAAASPAAAASEASSAAATAEPAAELAAAGEGPAGSASGVAGGGPMAPGIAALLRALEHRIATLEQRVAELEGA